MSSQKEKFRVLAESHGLVAEDFFKAPQGFWIITRKGVEKIQRGIGCMVHYEVVPEFSDVEKGMYCIKLTAWWSTRSPTKRQASSRSRSKQ